MMLPRSVVSLAVTGFLAGWFMPPASADSAPSLLWKRTPGTAAVDYANAVATDKADNVIVAGLTMGSMARQNNGAEDAFVVKYSADGTLLWRSQPHSDTSDIAAGVATDTADNVVVVGYTQGWLPGPKLGPGWDGFIVKFAADGTVQWRHQVGTVAHDDFVLGVATDAARNVLIAGSKAGDAFVTKYAPDGTLKWTRLLATNADDGATSVAVDAFNNVIVAGGTKGFLGGPNQGDYDLFIAKYSADGTLLWTVQPGVVGPDSASAVATDDAGNIFVVGGQPAPNFSSRGFVAAFSPDGTGKWRRTFGGSASGLDGGRGVAIESGNVVVSGVKFDQAFAASYSPDGTLLWSLPLPMWKEWQVAVTTDSANNIITAGGAQTTPERGLYDGLVAKYGFPAP